jgi:glycosyltransferase involved in cell wall biosynthesis
MENKMKYKVALFSECYGQSGYGGPVARHYNIAKVLKSKGIDFKVFGFNPRQVHPDYELEEAVGGWPKELNQFNIFWVEQGFGTIYKLNELGIKPILGCNLVPNSASMHCLPYLDEAGRQRQEASIKNEKNWVATLQGKFWCSQSYFQEKEYRRLGLPFNEKVYRLNNPVDTEKFKPTDRIRDKKFKIAWAGKVNWAKAPWILNKIAERLPEIEFHYISNESCNIQFSSNVKMILNNENSKMPELLNDCDCYISTSVTENQPLAGLEAMACGLPIIVFKTSGWDEICKHNYNGYLVDLANIDHFIGEIRRMEVDDLRRIYYGQNNREYILNNFSFNACWKQYEALFKKYLGIK